MGTEIFKKVYPCRKHIKRFPVGKKSHPTPGTLSNQLSVTWATRRRELKPSRPSALRYAEQKTLPPHGDLLLQGNLLGGQESAAAEGAK